MANQYQSSLQKRPLTVLELSRSEASSSGTPEQFQAEIPTPASISLCSMGRAFNQYEEIE